jgi:hypothetical protein
MKGSKILINADPHGRREEGTITDTSKPGTLMERVPATAMSQGRFSWRAASATAGAKGQRIILLENWTLGKIYSDAYAANERCFLYWLQAGDECNVILLDVAGTGDAAIAIGDLFGVNNTGKITRNSAYTSTPFESQEAVAAGLAADYLLWCVYRGDQA